MSPPVVFSGTINELSTDTLACSIASTNLSENKSTFNLLLISAISREIVFPIIFLMVKSPNCSKPFATNISIVSGYFSVMSYTLSFILKYLFISFLLAYFKLYTL